MNRHYKIQFCLLGILLVFFQCICFSQTQTLSSSFKIIHTSTIKFFECRKFIHTKDSATIIVGKWGTSEDGADLMLMKLDEQGQVVWAKRIPVGSRLDEYELTEMSDGSIYFLGNGIDNQTTINYD